MAITQTMCTSFKGELLGGIHDLDTHTLKMALIKPSMSGTYDATTTNYSDVTGNSDEVTGTNYSAGGVNIANVAITTSGTTGIVDFDNVVFSSVDIDARGAIIYNSSASNKAIAVLDFGETKTATDGDFTVVIPAAGASTAIIRIA